MSKIYGYCRISTKQQNIERQVRNILDRYPDAVIVREVYTGTKVIGRHEFKKMLGNVKSGDTIVFDEVSRMSRNAEEGYELYMELYGKGVNLVFLKEPEIGTDRYKDAMERQIVRTKTGKKATDKLLNAISDALQEYMQDLSRQQIADAFARSQAEIDYLHKRTKEGMETARLNGEQIGQRSGNTWETKKEKKAKKRIRELSRSFEGSLKDSDVWKLCGISRNSFYKYKRELIDEING